MINSAAIGLTPRGKIWNKPINCPHMAVRIFNVHEIDEGLGAPMEKESGEARRDLRKGN